MDARSAGLFAAALGFVFMPRTLTEPRRISAAPGPIDDILPHGAYTDSVQRRSSPSGAACRRPAQRAFFEVGMTIRELWRRVRGQQAHPGSRFCLTLAVGCLLAALGLVAAWGLGWWLPTLPAAGNAGRPFRMYVRDESIVMMLLAAGIAWLWAIWLIWSPIAGNRAALAGVLIPAGLFTAAPFVAFTADSFFVPGRIVGTIGAVAVFIACLLSLPFISRVYAGVAAAAAPSRARSIIFASLVSAGLIVAFGAAGLLAERLVRNEEELIITAVLLVGGGLLLWVWIRQIELGGARPLIARDGTLNVNCPECGYSLIGLSELRCPECGTRFVLDELIRAQNYQRPES